MHPPPPPALTDVIYRFLLEALDNQTKSAQEGNKAHAWLMCCVKCCAWCLEKIVMFINRNAYIMVGIKGTNYCSSACRALKLVLSVRHSYLKRGPMEFQGNEHSVCI